MSRPDRPDWYWEIAIAANAVIKGVLAAAGESGHIAASADGYQMRIEVEQGFAAMTAAVAAAIADSIEDGDVVVVADKVVATSLGRLGPGRILLDPDPKTIDPAGLASLAAHWTAQLGFVVDPVHLLLADEYGSDLAALGTDEPNRRAAEIASALLAATGRTVDVVISDTDTGLDTRVFLIGTLTLGATPLGATAGLSIYEAMRCAVAAEVVRGHLRSIPVVVCRPAARRRCRDGAGRQRGYPGFLDAAREPGLALA